MSFPAKGVNEIFLLLQNYHCWLAYQYVDDVFLPAVVSKLKIKQKLNISGDLSFLKGTFSTDGQNMTEEDYNIY